MADIVPIKMPKWGLSMQEGTVVHWWKEPGSAVSEGEDLVDIETPKITNVFESPASGTLRRVTANTGDTRPVGALIAVLADPSVSDADIDVFVADFEANFVPDEEEEGGGAFTLETIDVEGRTIRVGRAGQGGATPALLIHGYSGDLNSWLFNIEELASERPVVAIDLPGHGESSKDIGDGSLKTLAAIVAAVLRQLDIACAHIVGHSLGGAIATRLAIDNPSRVASLTLICPSSLPGTAPSEEFLTGIAEAQRARDLKPLLEMLFAEPSLVTKDMVEAMAKYKRLDGVEEALTLLRNRLLGEEDRIALAQGLGRIAAATVIASTSDRIVGAPDVAALPKSFAVHFIEGAGHMPHMEKPKDVNAILAKVMH